MEIQWWQVFVLACVTAVIFVCGFLLGEYLHGLSGTLTGALSEMWNRFTNLFRPHGADVPRSVRASDGTLVLADGICHNGWSAEPGEAVATRCVAVDGPEIA